MAIIVKNEDGFQLIVIEDETLLTQVQNRFPDPPFTVESGPTATHGPLAPDNEIRALYLEFIRFRLRQRKAALKQALQDATDLASLKPALRDLFEMFEEFFEMMR